MSQGARLKEIALLLLAPGGDVAAPYREID